MKSSLKLKFSRKILWGGILVLTAFSSTSLYASLKEEESLKTDSPPKGVFYIDGKEVNISRHLERFKTGWGPVYNNRNPTEDNWREYFRFQIESSIERAKNVPSKEGFVRIRMADDPDYGVYDPSAFLTLYLADAEIYLSKFNELFPLKK